MINLRLPWTGLVFLAIGIFPVASYCQDTTKMVVDGTQGEMQLTKDSISHLPPKKPRNQFDLGFTTLKIGAGFLYDFVTYSQDDVAKKQADSGGYSLEPAFKTRDFRVLVSGKFNTRRTISWRAGFMYDGETDAWFLRETGIMIGVPELWGHIFVGRTKEGFSLNKVMVGYTGWTMERQMAIDAVPLLADGIKWLGYLPKQKILWNLGAFSDWTSKNQSFSTHHWQVVARVAYLPINSPKEKKLLHLGINVRHGEPEDQQIRLRSRPEANPAPHFIDTESFPSKRSTSYGYEAYYTSGPLMLGSEYYIHNYKSPANGNPRFHGGEVVLSYILTGESRPYSTVTGIFSFVPVSKPVFKGGWGAWEVLLRYSQLDLDDGAINGGKFWRITPMVNWYLTRILRLEFVYGYGVLDRYGLKGGTQFFQSRLQLAIL
jgi:phosphate-selective porin OprO/OprP